MFKQRQVLHFKIVFYFLINLFIFSHSSVSFATPTIHHLPIKSEIQPSHSQVQDKPKGANYIPSKSILPQKRNSSTVKRSSSQDHHSALRKSTASILAMISAPIIAGPGHYLIDESKVATQLFWWKLGGTLGILSGASALASTGASNVITPWAIPTLIISGASFVMPTIFDILGIWSSPHSLQTQDSLVLPPLRAAPLLQDLGTRNLQLGIGSRKTVQQSTHAFYELTWSQSLDQIAYQLAASWADQQARLRLNLQHKLSGGRGWRLWQGFGLTTHHHRQAQLDLYQGEYTLRLAFRFGQLLHQKFKHFSGEIFTGWYGGAFAYPKGSLDQTTGILGGFALVHHSFKDYVRFKINYNHRHDDWVGGAIVPGVGSGILGYVQSSLSLRLKSDLWLQTQASFGSAHLYVMHLTWTS